MSAVFILLALLITATPALGGGQHVIPDYAAAQRDWFWTKLYVNGGRELYCNVGFLCGQRVTVKHVYRSWLDC